MLLGIGESAEDRARTASECGEAAAAHGHVGEFIVQPLVGGAAPFDARELPEAVFQARRRLPPGVVVQIPPNLAVQRRSGSGEWDYSTLLQCLEAGARDLGGVSPRDEVNAGHAFPALAEVEAALGARGWALRSRLPLHPAQYALLEGGSSSGEAWGAMQPWLALRALPGGTRALLA
jgi:FO synthase subunit 1